MLISQMQYTYLNIEAVSRLSVEIISLNFFYWSRDWDVCAIYCSNNSRESFQKITASVYQLLISIIRWCVSVLIYLTSYIGEALFYGHSG